MWEKDFYLFHHSVRLERVERSCLWDSPSPPSIKIGQNVGLFFFYIHIFRNYSKIKYRISEINLYLFAIHRFIKKTHIENLNKKSKKKFPI